MNLLEFLARLFGAGREAAPAAASTATPSPPAIPVVAVGQAPAAAPPSAARPAEIIPGLTDLLQRFEGVSLAPYLCPAGVPTIGIGTTRYPGGRRVTLSDPPITIDQARAFAAADLAEAAGDVDDMLAVRPLLPRQRAALALFVHNLGPGALADSTLLRLVRAGAADADIREAFGAWCKARDPKTRQLVPLKGLRRRRRCEAAIWEGEPPDQAWQTAVRAWP